MCPSTSRTSASSSSDSVISGAYRRNRPVETVRICSVMTQPPPEATWTAHGEVKVEARRDHERRPVSALLAALDGIEVDKPHVAGLDRWPSHLGALPTHR